MRMFFRAAAAGAGLVTGVAAGLLIVTVAAEVWDLYTMRHFGESDL